MEQYWFLAVVVAIAALVIYADWLRAKRRREAMQALAREIGFTWAEEAHERTAAELPLFARGHSGEALNALSGTIGNHRVVVMDYKYTTGSGRNRHTHRQTVALFPDGGSKLPAFEIGPESLFHKIAQVFGQQDIDFESDPDFSGRFLLRGADEGRIRALFGAGLRSAWCQSFGGWSVQAGDGQVLAFRAGKTVATEDMRAFLAETARIVDALRSR